MTVAISQTLTPIEQAWLRIETPENPTVTTVAMVCEGPLDPAQLKSRVEDRLLPEERLRQRIEFSPLPLARPAWRELEHFQLSDHFFPESHSGASLSQVMDRLGSQSLDDKLPLWQVHLADLESGGSAVLFRLHASVADSKAAISLSLRLLDTDSPSPIRRSTIGFEHLAPLTALREGGNRTASATRALCQLITSRADRDNPFRHPSTGSRVTTWSEPVDLGIIESQAEGLGCSGAEVLVGAVVSGLRKAVHRSDLPAESLRLKAVIPLDLRMPGDRLAGTRLALGMLTLPVGAASLTDRLEAIREGVERFSLSPECFAVLGLEAGMTLSMSEIEERSVRLMCQKASASLAILDGPAEAQSLCGQPVSQLLWQRAMPGDIALSLSLVVYADQVRFGVSCDEALEVDPALMAADMAAAAARI